MARPNVVKEANTRLPSEDPERSGQDRRDWYTEKNPFGPYYRYRHRPDGNQGQEYIPGQSTQQNIDRWSQYAARNSGPKVAPGVGRKGK